MDVLKDVARYPCHRLRGMSLHLMGDFYMTRSTLLANMKNTQLVLTQDSVALLNNIQVGYLQGLASAWIINPLVALEVSLVVTIFSK